jgi:Ala-tRNA(Pro) deacylase
LEGTGEAEETRARRVYDVLERLGIRYTRFEHPPVASVEDAQAHWADIDAMHFKNLFLRNKKGNRQYLVIAEHRKPVDLRSLAARIGDDRLSFGSPERLMAAFGVTPGSVSPFGLINDAGHSVRVLVDADLKRAAAVTFHPNVNTATLRIPREDFERFLAWCGNTVQWVAF